MKIPKGTTVWPVFVAGNGTGGIPFTTFQGSFIAWRRKITVREWVCGRVGTIKVQVDVWPEDFQTKYMVYFDNVGADGCKGFLVERNDIIND